MTGYEFSRVLGMIDRSLVGPLAFMVLLLAAGHYSTLLWFYGRLHPVFVHTIGVVAVGVPLSWYAYSQGQSWWLYYWLFFGVGGVSALVFYALDWLIAWIQAARADKETLDAVAVARRQKGAS